MAQSSKYLDAPDFLMYLGIPIDSVRNSLLGLARRDGAIERRVKAADQARDRRDWRRAVNEYKAAIAANPDRADLKVQLGHALKEIGDFDGAERMYREFLSHRPHDADIHLQLGHLFNKKGDIAAARVFYDQARKLAPEDTEIAQHADQARHDAGRADVLRKRDEAMALVASQRWDEARKLLRSLVTIDGEDDLIGILANVTKETGNLDEAAVLYRRYLHYGRSRGRLDLVADCCMQLGHLHKILGEFPVALKHFLNARKVERAAGQIDPDDSLSEREAIACARAIYPCFVFPE